MREKRMNHRDTGSEKQFLDTYRMSDYERPSVTADIVVLKLRPQKTGNFRKDPEKKLSLLLIRRAGHPFQGCWALPGGFLTPNETIEECALREVMEETSVRPASMMSIGLFSAPGRDPRGWIISNAFVSVLGESADSQMAGSDAGDAQWFDVCFENHEGEVVLELEHEDVKLRATLQEEKSQFGMSSFTVLENEDLAFDHAEIIARALSALRNSIKDLDMIFDFLPEKFTLTELQNVQETIMNISVLTPNFRRKVASLVVETDEFTEGAGHRPAKLYRKR